MTRSSSLDKAVLAAVKEENNIIHFHGIDRTNPCPKCRSLQRLRRKGAIRYDRKKGWTIAIR